MMLDKQIITRATGTAAQRAPRNVRSGHYPLSEHLDHSFFDTLFPRLDVPCD